MAKGGTTRCHPTPRRAPLTRGAVLVEPEEVVGVVLLLETLQPRKLLGTIGLADAILALLHEEVHIYARVVGRERVPVAARPLALLVEAVGRLAVAVDVERVARVATVEGGVVLADARHRPSHLPEGDAGDRRGDLHPVLG